MCYHLYRGVFWKLQNYTSASTLKAFIAAKVRFVYCENRDLSSPAEKMEYFRASWNNGWHGMRICLVTFIFCTSYLCPLLNQVLQQQWFLVCPLLLVALSTARISDIELFLCSSFCHTHCITCLG